MASNQMEEISSEMFEFETQEMSNLGGETDQFVSDLRRLQDLLKTKQELIERMFSLAKDLNNHVQKIRQTNRSDQEPNYDEETYYAHYEEYERLEEEVEEIEELFQQYEGKTQQEMKVVKEEEDIASHMDDLREELEFMENRLSNVLDDLQSQGKAIKK